MNFRVGDRTPIQIGLFVRVRQDNFSKSIGVSRNCGADSEGEVDVSVMRESGSRNKLIGGGLNAGHGPEYEVVRRCVVPPATRHIRRTADLRGGVTWAGRGGKGEVRG